VEEPTGNLDPEFQASCANHNGYLAFRDTSRDVVNLLISSCRVMMEEAKFADAEPF
jgi:hypothetical protein